MSVARRGVKKVLHGNRRFSKAKRKKFEEDRVALCDYLRGLLGKDWASASVPARVSRCKARVFTAPSSTFTPTFWPPMAHPVAPDHPLQCRGQL